MIAYNSQQLDNLSIQKDAGQAFYKQCVTQQEYTAINNAYPVSFYMPNAYIRIGLFLLTLVIAIFSFGLLCLVILSSGGGNGIAGLTLFTGAVAYFVLEYLMIRQKKHYQSGVDDALLWITGILLISTVIAVTDGDITPGLMCFLVWIIATFFTLRFADRVMSVLAFVALLGVVFYLCLQWGAVGKIVAPFLLMSVSYGVYAGARKLVSEYNCRHYAHCLDVISVAALLTGYLAVNYFVVREMSNNMFNLNLQPGDSIPAGWLFWSLTILIPVVYFYFGLRRKDRILICTALLLTGAIAFTIRYYHSIAPLEVVMTVSGIVLIAIAYGLTRYLKQPRYGFTSEAVDETNAVEKLHLESLIIAQTLGETTTPGNGFEFGGGTGGGGGATGEY